MKLYAVKNDDGLYLKFDEYGDSDWYLLPDTWSDKSKADSYANDFHGHVVELVEAPAKVVVSAEEDKVLKKAKNTTVWRPASVIAKYAYEHERQVDDEVLLEDRLMRAYVLGWTVEKPKRYFVRVPHANRHYYYQKCDSGELIPTWDMEKEPPTQFTAAEIEHYGLQDCEKVEVTDDAD